MNNMDSIIKSHNKEIIMKSKKGEEQPKCNCQRKSRCPLNGCCLETAIVYKATIKHGDEEKCYFGLTGGTFKDRYRNHVKSFKHEKYHKETQLSKYVWDLKDSRTDFEISWSIARKSNIKLRKSGQCNLCLEEKLLIMMNKNSLNRRNEIMNKCRHIHHPPRPPDRDPSHRAESTDAHCA